MARIQRALLEESDLAVFAAEGELRLDEIVDELLDQLAERATLWERDRRDRSGGR